MRCRLVFNDAATFDYEAKTGGLDGSIILNKAEASRAENAGLGDYVKKLGQVKVIVDEGNEKLGSGPISWADLMVLGAKVAVEKEWFKIKISRAADPSGGETIAKQFGSDWPVRLGRIDSTEEAPGRRVIAPNSSTEDMQKFMLGLGTKPGLNDGPFAPKAPFWEKYTFIIWTATQDDPVVRSPPLLSLSCRAFSPLSCGMHRFLY